METMLRRDPITGLYENVPLPEEEKEVVNKVEDVLESLKDFAPRTRKKKERPS